MTKSYMIQNASAGCCLGWQIISHSSIEINVELKEKSGKLCFSEKISNKSIRIPNAQGALICNDTELSLAFTCDSGLDLVQLSQDLLSDCGESIGHTYHYNGNVVGKTAEDIHVVITMWKSNNAVLSEKEFIAECFYKYLSEKNHYLFNYVSDDTVKEYYYEMENKYSTKFDYRSWYNEKIKTIGSALNQYKLVFALLLNYDKHCLLDTRLQYFVYKNIVVVFGKKVWNEEKLTVGSSLFQNIRGIILNDAELADFNRVHDRLNSAKLFTNGSLKVAASYANKQAALVARANRGLNFENIGLMVSAEQSQQVNVISNSVSEADSGSANILIFPELSVNGIMLDTLADKLRSTSNLNLVVGGSYYKGEPDSAFKNVSSIYAKINSKWEKITEYNKLIPFTMGYTTATAKSCEIDMAQYPLNKYKLLVEDIEMNDNITLLPYSDCVVGIAICRDVMDLLEPHNPLHKYCNFVDVMLVISDNNGDSNMFVGIAECLARWHNCATVYTNSIHEAVLKLDEPDNHLEISFALYPYKGKNVSGSTSVSGEINYFTSPFVKSDIDPGFVTILYSKGIAYNPLDESKYCKIYEIKAEE